MSKTRKKKNFKLFQRLTKQKKTLALVTLAIICIIWLTNCTSGQIQTIAVYEVSPPDPYINGKIVWEEVRQGQSIEAKEDAVLLPYWYFEKIFDYITDTQAIQTILKSNNKNIQKP